MERKYLDKLKKYLENNKSVHFRIGIDQDWVLAKLTEKWVRYYNTIFEDDLQVEDIKDWNIIDYVKEEAKPYMLNILNIHKFYRDLEINK